MSPKIWIPVAVIIIVLVVIFAGKDKAVDPMVPEENTTDVTSGGASGQFMKLGANAIVVQEQMLGDVVFMSALNIEKAGFVIIHDDMGGKPGDIIGVSKWFAAGNYANEDIGTTEKLIDGSTYYAMLHADDGDGVFDPKKDVAVMDSMSGGNEAMMAIFSASANASDPRDSQIMY
jgi:hypothetical protein